MKAWVAVTLLVAGGLVALIVWEAQRWAKYKREHHCAEVSRRTEMVMHRSVHYEQQGQHQFVLLRACVPTTASPIYATAERRSVR